MIEVEALLYLRPKLSDENYVAALSDIVAKDYNQLMYEGLEIPERSLILDTDAMLTPISENHPIDTFVSVTLKALSNVALHNLLRSGKLPKKYEYALCREMITHPPEGLKMRVYEIQKNLDTESFKLFCNNSFKYANLRALIQRDDFSPNDFQEYLNMGPLLEILDEAGTNDLEQPESESTIEKLLMYDNYIKNRASDLRVPINTTLYRGSLAYPHLFTEEQIQRYRNQAMNDLRRIDSVNLWAPLVAYKYNDTEFFYGDWTKRDIYASKLIYAITEEQYEYMRHTYFYYEWIRSLRIMNDSSHPLSLPHQLLSETAFKILKDMSQNKKLYVVYIGNSDEIARQYIYKFLKHKIGISSQSYTLLHRPEPFKCCSDLSDYINNESMIVRVIKDRGRQAVVGISVEKFMNPKYRYALQDYLLQASIL